MLAQARLQTGTSTGLRRVRARMAGILMLGLWLSLIGLASSERLHQFFHSDSQQTRWPKMADPRLVIHKCDENRSPAGHYRQAITALVSMRHP